jgi:predicted GH43/DUF377 family glycosyl hydrolase
MQTNFEWRRWSYPVIPTKPGTWRQTYTANADLIELNEVYYMYYRGTGFGHDRIGLLRVDKDRFDGEHWEEPHPEPILDVGAPGSFDDINLLDPSAAVADGTVYLYYSAVGTGGESIGLATSTDGVNFTKHSGNPVLQGRCPEIVCKDGKFYLYYVLNNGYGGYNIHLAVSNNGFDFEAHSESPILSVDRDAWDSQTVTTPRIFQDRGLYYMIYAGDHCSKDDPKRFGLSTSRDLIHWRKYEANPIFEISASKEAWDNTSIWYGTVEYINGTYWMWYEASNEYELRGTPEYISAVGLATLRAPYFFVNPEEEE